MFKKSLILILALFISCETNNSENVQNLNQENSIRSKKHFGEVLIAFDRNSQNNSRAFNVVDLSSGEDVVRQATTTTYHNFPINFNWHGGVNNTNGGAGNDNEDYTFEVGENQYIIYVPSTDPEDLNAVKLSFYSTNAPDIQLTYDSNGNFYRVIGSGTYSQANYTTTSGSLTAQFIHYEPTIEVEIELEVFVNEPLSPIYLPARGGNALFKEWNASTNHNELNLTYTWYKRYSGPTGTRYYAGVGEDFTKMFTFASTSNFWLEVEVVYEGAPYSKQVFVETQAFGHDEF